MLKRFFQVGFFLLMVLTTFHAHASVDYIWAYQGNGLAQFEEDGKIGLLDRKGNVICEAIYEGMSYFDKYGYAMVYVYAEDGYEIVQIGIIDETGKQIVPFGAFSGIYYYPFPEGSPQSGYFVVRAGTSETYFSLKGQRMGGHFTMWKARNHGGDAGIGFVTQDGETWILLDDKGEQLTPFEFYKIEPGYTPPTEGGHEGYAETPRGYVVVNDAGQTTKEYWKQADGTYKLISFLGEEDELKLLKGYDDWDFNEYFNLYRVQKDGKWGAVSLEDGVLIEPIYDTLTIRTWTDGTFFYAQTGERACMLTLDGKMAFPPQWESLSPVGEYFIVSQDGKMGVVSTDGTVVVDAEWEMIDRIPEVGFPVKKEDVMGIVSEDGKFILEPVWSAIWSWEKSDDESVTVYAENAEGQAYIFSNKGQVLKTLNGTYQWLDTNGDFTLDLYREIDENEKTLSWILYNRKVHKIIAKFDSSEFSFVYADGEDYYNYLESFDKMSYIGNILYKGERGFLTPTGEIVTNKDWHFISNFSENHLAFIEAKNGKYGVVNTKGEWISPPVWDVGALSMDGRFDYFTIGAKQYAKVGLLDEQDVMVHGFIDELGQPISGIKMPIQ